MTYVRAHTDRAVNLSDAEELTAVDIRTDPLFTDDLVLAPEYDVAAADIAVRLRRRPRTPSPSTGTRPCSTA
ncbi:hypothetical protein [Nocardia lijiangensis]|uniref:hypothetical protein n=1 Tax=Nocardia lijiangensis TaxID=299618 RepID=UPI003D75FD35